MRVKSSLRNAAAGITLQGIIMALGFISRKIFIMTLGEEYLGLNGLFTNVLSLLSMAELGVSTSIIYSLYSPLANDNTLMIAKLMNFYKITYRIIAGVIFTLGILVLPFINRIVGQTTFDEHFVQINYLLFLIMTVSTYFFSYKRSLIYADQKNYKTMYFDIFFKFISFILSTISLVLYKCYIIYLCCILLVGIINNYLVAKNVDKLYPFLITDAKLRREELEPIITNTKNIFIHKVAGTLISSTDNIMISAFLGILQVAIYSNYSLIVMSIQGITSKLLDSAQASIGNLLVKQNNDKVEETLKNMTLLSFMLTSVCTVSLFCLTNDFIILWLGKEFLLEVPILGICVINFFTFNIKNPLYQFVNVSGLFKEDRNNAIIGAMLNLGFSLAFVNQYGIVGIFLGAWMASLTTLVLKSNFFYRQYFNKSSVDFLKKMTLFFIIIFFEMFISFYACSLITLSSSILSFSVKCVICIVCPNVVNIVVFHDTKEFKYLLRLVTPSARSLKLEGI